MNSSKSIYAHYYSDPINDYHTYRGLNLETGESCSLFSPEKYPGGFAVSPDKIHFAYDEWDKYGVNEICDPLSVSVVEDKTQNEDQTIIYPNPAKEELRFNTDKQIKGITIIDQNGKMIIERTGNIRSVNISKLAAGVYFINIETTNGRITTNKFIIE